jgi:methanogenic corrinoid protein MtbC1
MSGSHEQARLVIAGLADDAVEATLVRLYERYPALYRRFGDAGRRACRDDLRFHLAFLDGALAAEEPAAFADYVAWLAGILESRSVPTASLAASLELLADFFASHLTPGQSAVVGSVLATGGAALRASGGSTAMGAGLARPGHPHATSLADLLTHGDRNGSRALANEAAEGGMGYLDLGVGLFQPALYQVGELWRQNRISVAQEHLATAMVQSYLADAYARAAFAGRRPRRAVCACVEGNQHALGLRLVADAFEIAGWDAAYLGPNVPTRDLLALVDAHAPDLVALSVSTTFQLTGLRAAVSALRGELAGRCPAILIGGLATNGLPDLWRRLGADDWCADALDAHALAAA